VIIIDHLSVAYRQKQSQLAGYSNPTLRHVSVSTKECI